LRFLVEGKILGLKTPGRERIGPSNITPLIEKSTMDVESIAELHATLVEISASAAVMQSEIKALLSTHPNPEALRTVFLQEIEKHTARSLALPVPDELCDRIEALAQRALKDFPAAKKAGGEKRTGALAGDAVA
jgi:hypothetical protein